MSTPPPHPLEKSLLRPSPSDTRFGNMICTKDPPFLVWHILLFWQAQTTRYQVAVRPWCTILSNFMLPHRAWLCSPTFAPDETRQYRWSTQRHASSVSDGRTKWALLSVITHPIHAWDCVILSVNLSMCIQRQTCSKSSRKHQSHDHAQILMNQQHTSVRGSAARLPQFVYMMLEK